MNRRHFINLSGAALTGLLFVKRMRAADASYDMVHIPEIVFVRLDNGLHELIASGQQQWSYEDVSVHLQYSDDALSVKVRSPKELLHQVALQWAYPLNNSAAVLGDHWERTYGDVSFQSPLFERKMPWYFIQHDGESTICFGVRTGCHAMSYWRVGGGTMQLTMDTRSEVWACSWASVC